jgi:hypothetical protein
MDIGNSCQSLSGPSQVGTDRLADLTLIGFLGCLVFEMDELCVVPQS